MGERAGILAVSGVVDLFGPRRRDGRGGEGGDGGDGGRAAMTQRRRDTGARGEALAAAWYQAEGYEVLERNWRCREGEIDLIAHRNRLVVICEVKTRTSDAFGVPAEAVTFAKRRKLRVLAARWLDEAPFRPRELRFDVAAILAGRIDVIEGAF